MARARSRAVHCDSGRPSSTMLPSDGGAQAGDEIDQRALAGAVSSHQRDELARAGLERDALDNRRRARPPARHRGRSARATCSAHAASQRASVSAASTTRGPGTTKASLVTAWTAPACAARTCSCCRQRRSVVGWRRRCSSSVSPMSPASTMTSGSSRMTVSIEMRGYSGRRGSSSTLMPPAIVTRSFRYEPRPTAIRSPSVPGWRPTMTRTFRGDRVSGRALHGRQSRFELGDEARGPISHAGRRANRADRRIDARQRAAVHGDARRCRAPTTAAARCADRHGRSPGRAAAVRSAPRRAA